MKYLLGLNLTPDGASGTRSLLFPVAALVTGVAASVLLSQVVKENIENEAHLRFERQASDAKHVIEARIKSYTDVLHGLSALFASSKGISRADFQRYVIVLDLPHRYPGFQALNYAEYVTPETKAAFEARVRNDKSLDPNGYPDFAVKPAGDRSEYFVLNYIEPMAGNEAAFGLDLGANRAAANPRAIANALSSARDTGKLAASGQLVNFGSKRESAILAMRLPVYRSGAPRETVEQRRAAYVGSVGAGFRVHELVRGALDESALQQMHFRLYDAGPAEKYDPEIAVATEEKLLFDSDDLRLARSPDREIGQFTFGVVLPIEVGGRIWDVHFTAPREAFVKGADVATPWVILGSGILISLLLVGMVHSLVSSRGRALEMAKVITKDLRESEESLAEAQRMAHLGNWSCDPITGTMAWSDEMRRIFGIGTAAPTPLFDDFLRWVHKKDQAAFAESLKRVTNHDEDRELEHRIRARDGTTRWVHTIMRPAHRELSNARIQGTIRDITETKLASLRLQVDHGVTQLAALAKDSEEIIPKAIETVCTAFGWECGAWWSLDKDGSLLRCATTWRDEVPRVAEFLNLMSQMSVPSGIELPGRAWAQHEPLFVADVGKDQGFSRSDVALRAGLRGAVAIPVKVGDRFGGVMELFSSEAIAGDEMLMNLLKGVSAQIGHFFTRKHAEDALRFVATHDSLTDLGNRAIFTEQLGHALARADRYKKGLAVLFVDIDRFKIVNDTLGHTAGDRMLQECARRLKDCLRGSDTVARLGGDEFVVMVEDFSGPRDAIAVAQKILTSLSRPLVLEAQELNPSASIGIAIAPDDGADVEMLLKNADIAMYRAKEQGRNNYQFYSAQMNKHTFERLAMESSLRKATERGEFLLHYQPKLHLETGAISGVEALVRWRHPDMGMVPPVQFIPIAEETGLIGQIGEWVLRTACEQGRKWREAGLPAFRIAVNLSARQFAQKNLLADVARIMAETSIPADGLEFEITESLMMQNPEHATQTLHKLRGMGIHLSIDDFGTGYSSLGYLKRFPINCVKVDRSFIKDIPNDKDDMAITRGVIALGHSLRLKVVAEGVETKEQQDFLHENGCDEMQGYLFSKPLAADEITKLLTDHKPRPRLTVVSSRKRGMSAA
jgi:diguanylate cyclase (GGDEF)-like protein/PAS domain S-box-containing protein